MFVCKIHSHTWFLTIFYFKSLFTKEQLNIQEKYSYLQLNSILLIYSCPDKLDSILDGLLESACTSSRAENSESTLNDPANLRKTFKIWMKNKIYIIKN